MARRNGCTFSRLENVQQSQDVLSSHCHRPSSATLSVTSRLLQNICSAEACLSPDTLCYFTITQQDALIYPSVFASWIARILQHAIANALILLNMHKQQIIENSAFKQPCHQSKCDLNIHLDVG